jgi:hypothetical protein
MPYNPGAETATGDAVGGPTNASCAAGGHGYAIVTYSP